jgi:hypothetical protein
MGLQVGKETKVMALNGKLGRVLVVSATTLGLLLTQVVSAFAGYTHP